MHIYLAATQITHLENTPATAAAEMLHQVSSSSSLLSASSESAQECINNDFERAFTEAQLSKKLCKDNFYKNDSQKIWFSCNEHNDNSTSAGENKSTTTTTTTTTIKLQMPNETKSHHHHSQDAIDAKKEISSNLLPLLAVDYYEPPVRPVSSPSLTKYANDDFEAACPTSFGKTSTCTAAMEEQTSNEENEESTKTTSGTNNNCVEMRTNNSHNNNNNNNNNGNKTRFGGLIWRTSKERRKCNRRDKCNSGDSGIQIEIEQDEKMSRILRILPTQICSPVCAHVRRTHSVQYNGNDKIRNTDNNRLLHEEQQMAVVANMPKRSISQPNGLEAADYLDAYAKDSDSDSVASHEDTTITTQNNNINNQLYAEVLYNFTAVGAQELNLECGTTVEILRRESGPWWLGRLHTNTANNIISIPLELMPERNIGWFPKEFVRILTKNDKIQNPIFKSLDKDKITTTTTTTTSATVTANNATNVTMEKQTIILDNNITTIVVDDKPSITQEGGDHQFNLRQNFITNKASADLLRRSAVRELLDTEVNYVKLLAAICEGYLPAMSKRVDIFSPNSVRLIFSNILAIYKFQRQFLEELRKGIETNQIAKVFLKMHKGFLCYSTYCNAYPRAILELETYDHVKDAKTILDNCRVSENLAELPLSAHLLSPVQRICRYPLHLSEILKAFVGQQQPQDEKDKEEEEQQQPEKESLLTESLIEQLEQKDVSEIDLPDVQETIEKALDTMKSITEAVNEGKRHSETIARHQSSFQNFKGPPLHAHSTRFFLQIDATRLKQNLWNSSYTLFLFDNQLIYCKRDIIKRSQFIFKGRIFLNRCRIVNVRDGKMFGHAVRNSLRIFCELRHQWYDFGFRSSNRKQRFLNTLALERQFAEKPLHVTEMTDIEWICSGRDIYHSDQSDYDISAQKDSLGAYASSFYQGINNHHIGTSATSGESSGPDSPAKSTIAKTKNVLKFSETLPKKKSHSRYDCTNSEHCGHETHTGSLRRRRLGNWFRKSKSTNNTPNQSPTHEAALQPIVPLK